MIFNMQILPEVHEQLDNVTREFRDLFSSGFLELVLKVDGYGSLLSPKIPLTFGDSRDRVLWRSKENLDFCYVAEYASQFGELFLFMEDDVVPATNFIGRLFEQLNEFPLTKTHMWIYFSLYSPHEQKPKTPYYFDCCTQAVLFQPKDVPAIVEYVRKNYYEAPLDYLLRDYEKQTGRFMYYAIPNLVQHIQAESTFTEKGRKTHHSPTFEEGKEFVVD